MLKLDYPKAQGINIVGWSVSISNILLFVCYYYILLAQRIPVPPEVISFLSMAAVFPEDFFHRYLSEFWLVHFCWMFLTLIASFGIMLLNALARKMFIVLCVIHGSILTYIFFLHHAQPEFFAYFFKLYFNCAFIFAYVGFITIPEVRLQFRSRRERFRFRWWFQRSRTSRVVSQDAQGYYNLALAYNRLQRSADAVAALQKAIRINPEDDRYHAELGKQFALQKNNGEAIKALKEAVRLNPGNFPATFQLGQLYQLEGCGREMAVFLEKASLLQPNNSQVYSQLGKAYMLLENYPGAVKALQRAIQLNSRDSEAYYHLGWIFLNKMGNHEEARDALRAAVHLRSDMIEGHFQMGMACLRLGRHKDALRSFKEVIFRDDGHKQAHYQMGFVYLMLKDIDSARREIQILRGFDPEMASKLAMLVSAQVQQGS